MKALAWVVPVAVVLLLVAVFGLMYASASNREVSVRQKIEAQQKNLEVVFDNTWKVIQQTAEVADQYKEAFAKIYPELMQGRYGNARGGALLSFITESNPTFDTKMYEKVANAIESQRNTFTAAQSALIDYKREHDTLLKTIPSSWFVGSRPEVEIRLVTSARTDAAFSTGKDDDVQVFKK